MPFTIIRNDITKMNVDAIVNAANTDLLMGGGVCGAIFNGAGEDQLQKACNALAPIKTGEAVITPGFDLSAKYIIHAVGPIYQQWSEEESEQHLHNVYSNALRLTVENQCESIAFPLISSGIYGYPKKEALEVATKAIREFLKSQELEVYLVLFDKSALKVSEELLGEVASFIDDHYVESKPYERRLYPSEMESRPFFSEEFLKGSSRSETIPDAIPRSQKLRLEYMEYESSSKPIEGNLDDLISNLDEPFSQTLLRLIDAKGMTDVEVYKAANLDRKLFSKIRIGKGYMPSKKTTLALAIALKLSKEETHDLLARAGYALSRSQIFDVIVEYFISKERYDIYEINQVLFSYDQQLLGS